MNFVKKLSFLPFHINNSVFQLGKVGLIFGSLAFGQWLLSDLVHFPGGGLGVFIVFVGCWCFFQSEKVNFKSPKTVQGWINRCNEVLEQFELLENKDSFEKNRKQRFDSLQQIVERSEPQRIVLASTNGIELPSREEFSNAISVSDSLDFSFSDSLPIRDESSILPDSLLAKDIIIYFLPLPLRAADLIWLKKIPEDQPSWIMVLGEENLKWFDQLEDLKAQLPERWISRIIRWNRSSEKEMNIVLNPIRKILAQPKTNIDLTKQRLLSRLHSSWQSDLEQLRRDKFQVIQNRSQWIVAGAVFTSPIPTTDLLSVAVVNGLMVQEMANIWSCKMKPELLKVVAKQLACAAIAQGVVEWSGQAILGVAKLHGGSWIAAGSMQALSAAYLTRVVGRSMSDWLALNNGVSEVDIELLNQQASQLVANAAEKERVDWVGFLNQCKDWMKIQLKESTDLNKIIEV